MRLIRKSKKYVKEIKFSSWKDVVVWKDFRSSYASKAVWKEYIQHVISKRFM
jgi:hypothetical protein